jgi:hypothetical protein
MPSVNTTIFDNVSTNSYYKLSITNGQATGIYEFSKISDTIIEYNGTELYLQ